MLIDDKIKQDKMRWNKQIYYYKISIMDNC